MRRHRLGRTVVAAIVVGVLGLAPSAAADTLSIEDPTGDVTRAESGTPASEPRVDITAVDVDHQARSLEIRMTVAQHVPFDDPVWLGGLFLQAALVTPDGDFEDGFWIWEVYPDGDGAAEGFLVSFTDDFDYVECPTEVVADEAARQYILRAGAECLADVPRSVRVATAMYLDDQAATSSDSFDYLFDSAPDDDFSGPVGSTGAATVTRLAGRDPARDRHRAVDRPLRGR